MVKESAAEKTPIDILEHDPESVLAFIQSKVQQLRKLNQIWHSVVTDIAKHSRVANYRENCLVIELDSGAWATRLRYVLPEITTKLLKHPDLKDLSDIEWYIQPHFHNTLVRHQTPPVFSNNTAKLLRNTADAIKDKPLQEALLQIARNNKEYA